MSDRSWVDRATIFRCEVGSGVHGIASDGTDDRDEMGVCLEPYPLACGIRETFEQHIYRTAAVRENKLGTGHRFGMPPTSTHHGTYQLHDGALVFHVFEWA